MMLRIEVDRRYLKNGDPRHRADIYRPIRWPPDCEKGEAKRPLLLYLHGGAWMLGDKGQWNCKELGKLFASHGYVVVVPNYRLSKISNHEFAKIALLQVTVLLCIASCTNETERRVWVLVAVLLLLCLVYFEILNKGPDDMQTKKHPAQLHDACAALAWATRNAHRWGANKNNVVLCGHSAGAHIVNLMVMHPTALADAGVERGIVRAVVGISGPYSAERMRESAVSLQVGRGTFGSDPMRWQHAFPLHYVRTRPRATCHSNPAVLLLNAEFDYGMRCHALDYYVALVKAGWCVERHAFADKGHFNVVGLWRKRDHAIFQTVQRFLRRHANSAFSFQL